MSVVLADEREDGRLDRRDRRMEAQHGALALGDDLLVVRVDEEREQRAVGAAGRLDHVRRVALAAFADVLELRPGLLRVLREVEVAAVRDALELRPADGEEVLDVARRRVE